MRHIELHYTGAVLCFLLFSTTGAQPVSILKIVENLQSAPQTYPTPLYSFSLCIEITNRVFNNSLLNTTSPQYMRLYAEVSGVLDVAFNCSNCDTRETYRGVSHMQFRSMPMMANCTIQFQTIFINHVVIKFLFLRALDNNNNTQLNGLALNRQYTAETVTPAWLFSTPTTPVDTAAPLAGSGGYWLPGWAIALLVLACIIILLLLILLLLMCCWCCRRRGKKEETTIIEHAPYQRTSFKEYLANPTYMPHTPEGSPNYPVLGDPAVPHGSHAGMYTMTPQR